MDPYWLFLKTVVHTVVSLMGAAAVLFTAGASPDRKPAQRPSFLRASFSVSERTQSQPAPADQRAKVTDALVGALKDTDADVRKHAAIALGEIGDVGAVPGLIEALADKQSDVRRAAAVALGELGDARAIEPLTRALKDADPSVRRAAVIAIAELSSADGEGRGFGRGHGSSFASPHPRANPNPNPRPRPSGA